MTGQRGSEDVDGRLGCWNTWVVVRHFSDSCLSALRLNRTPTEAVVEGGWWETLRLLGYGATSHHVERSSGEKTPIRGTTKDKAKVSIKKWIIVKDTLP